MTLEVPAAVVVAALRRVDVFVTLPGCEVQFQQGSQVVATGGYHKLFCRGLLTDVATIICFLGILEIQFKLVLLLTKK